MTITEKRPYGLIRSELKKGDKISLISCSSCVSFCGTGGKKEMNKLAKKLQEDGFEVLDQHLVGVACNFEQVKNEKFEGNVIIVLSCDAGVYNIKKIVGDKRVISALDTIGIGVRDAKGNINLVKEF